MTEVCQQHARENRIVEVCVRKLRLRAYLGVHDWEQQKLQDVVITFRFRFQAHKALLEDDPAQAPDYRALTKQVVKEVESSQFRLLESLASHVFHLVRNFPQVQQAEVVIDKPHALRFADSVSARIADDDW